jgi:biotin carboxylase
VLAEFMHRRLHEVPHSGGVSSLRKSWWHPDIRNDALDKLMSLGWEGVAMMEYRWDPVSDQFYLMEMNGRFWGSLHLPLYAGVDFPRLLLDAFHDRSPEPVRGFPLNIRCRLTFPDEVQYVWSRLKDRQLSLSSRLWSIIEFFLLFFPFRINSDLFFPGDRRLYWDSFRRFLTAYFPWKRRS